MKADVYLNLNKTKPGDIDATFSIRVKGKVIGYAKHIEMADVVFVVSEPGRQRVLRDKRKNVHAVCRGEVLSHSMTPVESVEGLSAVTYDPYKFGYFFEKSSGLKIATADKLTLGRRRTYLPGKR